MFETQQLVHPKTNIRTQNELKKFQTKNAHIKNQIDIHVKDNIKDKI